MLTPTVVQIAQLSAPGTSLTTLRSAYGSRLTLAGVKGRVRTYRLFRARLNRIIVRVSFDIDSASSRVTRTYLSTATLGSCHAVERAANKALGPHRDAEWGTKAYSLNWAGSRRQLSATFALRAVEDRHGAGIGTECELVLGN